MFYKLISEKIHRLWIDRQKMHDVICEEYWLKSCPLYKLMVVMARMVDRRLLEQVSIPLSKNYLTEGDLLIFLKTLQQKADSCR